jgi:hypothetical protein
MELIRHAGWTKIRQTSAFIAPHNTYLATQQFVVRLRAVVSTALRRPQKVVFEIWDAQLLRSGEGSRLMPSWLGTRITSALQLPRLIWTVSFLRVPSVSPCTHRISQMSEARVAKRKTHTKSRKGCFQCKQRHTKVCRPCRSPSRGNSQSQKWA